MQRLSSHLSDPVLQYETIETKDRRPLYRKLAWITGIAATIVFAFFLFTSIVPSKRSVKHNAENTVSTKRGSKSKIQLPDGTQVWLNADSRIAYNENFQGNLREVSLQGEAYFDVVRDEKRPFVIHTQAIDIKVLGTAFNVRSYENEKNTETSLIRGSIEVTLIKSQDKKKIILKPNEKLIVNNNQELLETSNRHNEPVMTLGKLNYNKMDKSAVEVFWVKNKLAFDQETLENIALKIERWYDVKVEIRDNELKNELYTGFFEDKSLQEVMEALKISAGGEFNYSIEGKLLSITRKN